MRVLYHHRTLADGAEGVHIAAMVQAFRNLGHDVRVSGLAAVPEPARRRGAIDRVRSALPRAAFEAASLAFDVAERRRVSSEIQQFRPDVVYKRHAKFDTGALIAASRSGTPTVLEVNCLFASDRYLQFEPLRMTKLARRYERRALAMADLVVAVSSPLGEDIRTAAPANVIVVPNGVDANLFDPSRADGQRIRRQYGIDPDAVTIGWTGIIREWHGLERLLEVVAAVPDITALIIGDGPGRAALEADAARLGVNGRVIFTGRVVHENVRDHLAAIDIAIVADERTGVASPMKLLEYMAMARAVIAPCQANIADLIQDRVNGVLFDGSRPGELASIVVDLVKHPAERQRLGDTARAIVQVQRTWTAVAEKILAELARVRPTVGCIGA